VIPYPWLGQDPAFVNDVGKFNFATIEPAVVRPCGDNKLVLEQCSDIDFIWNLRRAVT